MDRKFIGKLRGLVSLVEPSGLHWEVGETSQDCQSPCHTSRLKIDSIGWHVLACQKIHMDVG